MDRPFVLRFLGRPIAIAVVPILLAAAAPVALLAPVLVRGEALLRRDLPDYFLPLKHYTGARIAAGDLPLWNPLNEGGEPWLANLQSGVFYPPNLLFVWIPAVPAFTLYVGLHLFCGSLLWNAVLARRGIGALGRWAAALAWPLAGTTLSLIDVSNNLASATWIPVLLLGARGGWRAPAAALALMWLGGEPQLAAIAAAFVLLPAVLADRPRAGGGAGAVAVAAPAAALAVSLLLAAVAVVPFAELAVHSERAAGWPAEVVLRGSVPPASLGQLAWPRVRQATDPYLPRLYLGLPFVLAAAVALARGSRRGALFAASAAVLMLAACGSYIPGGRWLYLEAFHGLVRFPARLLIVATVPILALAAEGFDRARGASPAVRRACAALLLAGLADLWWGGRRLLVRTPARAALAMPPQLAQVVREVGPHRRVLPQSYTSGAVRLVAAARQPEASARLRHALLLGYSNLLYGLRSTDGGSPLGLARYRRVRWARNPGWPRLMAAAFQVQLEPREGPGRRRVVWLPARQPGDRLSLAGPVARRVPCAAGLAGLLARSTDPTRWLLVELPEGDCGWAPILPAAASAPTWLRDESEQLAVGIPAGAGAGYLLIADAWFPGWRARRDGVSVAVLPAQHALRAVPLVPGSRRVTLHYLPVSFALGMSLSLLALALFLAANGKGSAAALPSPK